MLALGGLKHWSIQGVFASTYSAAHDWWLNFRKNLFESNLLNYHFQVLLAMLSSHHPVNLEVFTHVSPICTWPWMLPRGKLTITSWKTASRGPILRRRKATCPGTVKAKSMHNSNKRSWPFQANQGMMSAGGGRWFFFTKGSRFWKKPKGRFEIENRWELGKKEKYLDLLILYLWRTWLDFPDRQEVHVFTVLIFQRWNSKKMNVSVVWFGEDTCSSWDSKHYKILQSQKKTRQRAYATHQSFTNFWWLEFLGGIHFSKGSAVHEKVASHLALFWIPYIDMDMCTVPPQLPPHWNFTATPQYNSRRQSLKHHFGFSVSNSQKSSSHSSLVW